MPNSTNDKNNLTEDKDFDLLEMEQKLNEARAEFAIEDVVIENSLEDLKEVLPDAGPEDLGIAGVELNRLKRKYILLKGEYIKRKIEKKYGSEATQEEIDELVRDENIKEFAELEEDIIKKRVTNNKGIYDFFLEKKFNDVFNIGFKNSFEEQVNSNNIVTKENITKKEIKNGSNEIDDSKPLKEKEIENKEKAVLNDANLKNEFLDEFKNEKRIENSSSDLNSVKNFEIEKEENKNLNEQIISDSNNLNQNDNEESKIIENKNQKNTSSLSREKFSENINIDNNIHKQVESEKEKTYIDFEDVLSENEIQAIKEVNLQKTKFMNNTEKYFQENKTENNNKIEYSREEAISKGLNILLSDNLSKDLIKHLRNVQEERKQFELVKNDIVNFCEEVNEESIFEDVTGEISAELLFKYNQKLFNILKQNNLNFPTPKFCDNDDYVSLKKDDFYYFLIEYLKKRGVYLSKRFITVEKNEKFFKKLIFEFYEIAGRKEERLIDDRIRKLRLLDNIDRNELGELNNRYINIIILSNSLLKENEYFDFEYSGRIEYGGIVIYGSNIKEAIKNKFTYLSAKEYVRQIAIPREKAYMIGSKFGMSDIFKEGVSDGFFLEYVENEDFQDLVDERISSSMHIPTHIISYFCLKGSLEKLEKNEKTDPIQIFNLLNYKKTNSAVTIDKFKKRYWEIFNDLYTSDTKESLLIKIRNLEIRGIDDDLEKNGF